MAIRYQNYRGQLFLCDFTGYKIPEIVKRRPVIAISPPWSHQTTLATIVPLSTTKPDVMRPYHFFIEDVPKMLPPFDKGFAWAKCDLIYTVSYERLFLPVMGKSDGGKRQYLYYKFNDEILEKILICVQRGLGIF